MSYTIQCIGINLIKYIQGINEEKYKPLLKDVKEGLNNWSEYQIHGWKGSILEK